MSHPFFTERTETCNCRTCNKDFKAYNYWEDCPNCNDGETDEGRECPSCGGSGTLDSVAKNICQDCLYVLLTKED